MLNHLQAIATTLVATSFSVSMVFSMTAPASAQQVVTCESYNQQPNSCSVDTRDGVRLVRQLSDTSCEGNWSYDKNRVWVRNGCRARFLVGKDSEFRTYDWNGLYPYGWNGFSLYGWHEFYPYGWNDFSLYGGYYRYSRHDWGDRYGRHNWGDRHGRHDWGDRYSRHDWGNRYSRQGGYSRNIGGGRHGR